MELLNFLIDNSEWPPLTALMLGLLTAISPCPLATNITAIGYISSSIENHKESFRKGIAYALGRILSFSLLGAIMIYLIRTGKDSFGIQSGISEWGELVIGPALVILGLFLLFGDKLRLPRFGFSGEVSYVGRWQAFLLGVLFAMAFCPSSGMLYFGMLIPMSVSAKGGYLLPVLFAIATSLPVLLISWFISFSVKNLALIVGKIKVFQLWFNRIVALLFIGVGLYFIFTINL